MQSITITRPVIIKVKVTEEYKIKAAAETQGALAQLDARLRQFELQAQRALAEVERKNPQGAAAARAQLESERQRLLEGRQGFLKRLKDLGALIPGDEVVSGQVESIIELKPGDEWAKVMGAEIVLEDGKVVQIRGARG